MPQSDEAQTNFGWVSVCAHLVRLLLDAVLHGRSNRFIADLEFLGARDVYVKWIRLMLFCLFFYALFFFLGLAVFSLSMGRIGGDSLGC
jgi:hypothetical protein